MDEQFGAELLDQVDGGLEGERVGRRRAVDRSWGRKPRTISPPVRPATAGTRFTSVSGSAASAAPIVPDLIEHADFSEASGAVAMRALLARDPALDAVFAASDLMALGAMGVLRAGGRGIPGDVEFVEFEDSPAAVEANPPLSSVRRSTQQFAAEMVALLLGQRGQPDDGTRSTAGPVVLPTSLVVRASS